MTTRIRTGGAWHVLANGGLHIDVGHAWRSPNICKIKSGPVGGGGWVDSGYVGLPAVPGTPAVYSWDYSNVGVYWGGGAGGAPVSNYIVERSDQFGNVNGTWDVGSATSISLPVTWDTLYRFRIYARSAGGLQAGPSGGLQIGIGHPQQDTYGAVVHTRPWSAHTSGQFGRDSPIQVVIPASVTINAVHWVNMRTPQSGTLNPNTTRDINWILNGGDAGPIRNQLGVLGSGNYDYAGADIGISGNNGQGNYWGVIPRGSGWSAVGNTTFMLWVDDFFFDGSEAYQQWEVVSSIPAVANYYW